MVQTTGLFPQWLRDETTLHVWTACNGKQLTRGPGAPVDRSQPLQQPACRKRFIIHDCKRQLAGQRKRERSRVANQTETGFERKNAVHSQQGLEPKASQREGFDGRQPQPVDFSRSGRCPVCQSRAMGGRHRRKLWQRLAGILVLRAVSKQLSEVFRAKISRQIPFAARTDPRLYNRVTRNMGDGSKGPVSGWVHRAWLVALCTPKECGRVVGLRPTKALIGQRCDSAPPCLASTPIHQKDSRYHPSTRSAGTRCGGDHITFPFQLSPSPEPASAKQAPTHPSRHGLRHQREGLHSGVAQFVPEEASCLRRQAAAASELRGNPMPHLSPLPRLVPPSPRFPAPDPPPLTMGRAGALVEASVCHMPQ